MDVLPPRTGELLGDSADDVLAEAGTWARLDGESLASAGSKPVRFLQIHV